MGALVNELHCYRCKAGSGMDDNFVPWSWWESWLMNDDESLTVYLCETCGKELREWLHEPPKL